MPRPARPATPMTRRRLRAAAPPGRLPARGAATASSSRGRARPATARRGRSARVAARTAPPAVTGWCRPAAAVGTGRGLGCTWCGDGVVQAADGETCDGTAGAVGAGCRADCTSCGDGVVQAGAGETCDGTAGAVGTGCRTDCTSCGDGVLQ